MTAEITEYIVYYYDVNNHIGQQGLTMQSGLDIEALAKLLQMRGKHPARIVNSATKESFQIGSGVTL